MIGRPWVRCGAIAAAFATFATFAAVACGGGSSRKSAASPPADTATSPHAAASTGPGGCPNTGTWAQCSLMYRLQRAGLVPRIDSSATVAEKGLSGKSFVIRFSPTSVMDVFLYPDSTARKTDGAKLDRHGMVSDSTPLTMAREKTLIEGDNIIAVLSSLNDQLRQRVGDAILAGAPEP